MAYTAPNLRPSEFTALAGTLLMQKPMPDAQFRSLVKDAQAKDGWARVVQRMSLAFAGLSPQAVPAAVAEASPDTFEMLMGAPCKPKGEGPCKPKGEPTPAEGGGGFPVEQVDKAMGHLSTVDHHQRKKKRTCQE